MKTIKTRFRCWQCNQSRIIKLILALVLMMWMINITTGCVVYRQAIKEPSGQNWLQEDFCEELTMKSEEKLSDLLKPPLDITVPSKLKTATFAMG